MFGRKKEGQPLSETEIITREIEALTPGQSLKYRLGEKYGSGKDVAVIQLNPDHGKKSGEEGRKYMVTIEVEGQSTPFGFNNNAHQLATFIIGRKGVKAT